MSYVPVMACFTECEPFLSSFSHHFAQLVHKEFVGGNRSKQMKGVFFPS